MTFTTQLRHHGEHAVVFSSDDHELVASTSEYVATGLRRGESLLVVATAAHVKAFMGALAEAGLEPELARTHGQIALLDADQMLAGLMVDGHPDPDRFHACLGGAVRIAVERGDPVRIYGEMVAALWDSGAVEAALELEELWNELSDEIDFSLLCGYRCTEASDPAELARICAHHDAIVGDAPIGTPGIPMQIASRTFGGTALDARVARRFTTEALEASGHGAIAEDAAIVVTELAANAVAHARSCFTVTLTSHDGQIRIAVRDDSPDAPGIHAGDDLESCGRGLRIVAAVADEWGAESDGKGKVVWALLRS
jgi:anti-sigma regulatory factor (Ser/Thr protein kinase)